LDGYDGEKKKMRFSDVCGISSNVRVE